MVTVLNFLPDLAPIKVEHRMRSQVLTGVLQGADHFTCIFSNGSYIGISLEVGCEAQYPRGGHLFIKTGDSSESDRWRWNVTSQFFPHWEVSVRSEERSAANL